MSGFIKNIKRKAFTLSELLIALGVIGVLTAIVMPIVFNLMPDQNVLMAKRAFYATEMVISDLMNDSYCYPKLNSRVGLDDGYGYARCKKWGGEENKGSLTNEDSTKKLITLFTDKLDIKGNVDFNNKTFKTKDGIVWKFSDFNFANNDPDSYVLLTVDVNGDKDPNCGQINASGKCTDKNRKHGFDKFTMRIFARGRIQILDCWAILAVRTDKKLVGKEEAVCDSQDSGTKKEECSDPPTSPDDFCCNDSKWKNSDICNSCTSTPTSADDYCCTEESESGWVGTEACDPCTYTKPESAADACCLEGHKWHGTAICNVCAQPYSKECCLSKLNSIQPGDKCCDHPEVRAQVSMCSYEVVTVTTKFYVNAEKPKDSNNWGKTKITAQSTLDKTLPVNLELKFIRSCPSSGVGCGTYGQGMSCIVNAGSTGCNASEEFVSGTFSYRFQYTKNTQGGDFNGFKALYTIMGSQNNYGIKFKFPSGVNQY